MSEVSPSRVGEIAGHRSQEPPPVDVRWRIESKPVPGGLVFEHGFTFPSGRVRHAEFSGISARLHQDDLGVAERRIYGVLEAALKKKDERGEPLLGLEIVEAVRATGADVADRFVPENVQELFRLHLGSIGSILLETDDPRIPWELARLGQRGHEDFICLQVDIGRWPADMKDLSPAGHLHLGRLLGLIAGTVRDYPTLRGASAEREILGDLLARNPEMRGEILVDPVAADFLDRLDDPLPDLLHFMGHGDTDAQDPDRASLIFADRSLPVHALSRERLRKIAEVRALVVLNACRTGRQGHALTGIGGWPDRWVRLGRCGALLCTQWAVRDGTATRFAEGFYSRWHRDPEMTLGRAVRETRRELLAEFPEDPTPLAYAFYGHPNAGVSFSAGAGKESEARAVAEWPRKELAKSMGSRDSARDSSRRSSPTHRQIRMPLLVTMLVAVIGLSFLFLATSLDELMTRGIISGDTSKPPSSGTAPGTSAGTDPEIDTGLSERTTKRPEIPIPQAPASEKSQTRWVYLVLPPALEGATIRVDGVVPKMVPNGTIVRVEIPIKDGNHRIEVAKGERICPPLDVWIDAETRRIPISCY